MEKQHPGISTLRVGIVGMGPAGLYAAETLARHGVAVTLFDAMPSPARKFLLAGRGGLNLTHIEPLDDFLTRYAPSGGAPPALMADAVRAFPPAALIDWVHGLGMDTFVGSSGRVFPVTMKASPLVRLWLARLDGLGVVAHLATRWIGFGDDVASGDMPANSADSNGPAMVIADADGTQHIHRFDAVILALGGASWPRLGSTGAWAQTLADGGVMIAPFVAANCGVDIAWSTHLAERFQGAPLKRIAVSVSDGLGPPGEARPGEAIITRRGLEGGAIYAVGADLRNRLSDQGRAALHIDLKPDMRLNEVVERLARPRGKASLANHLRKTLRLSPAAIALLREAPPLATAPEALATRIKNVALRVERLGSLERAISTDGGVAFANLDDGWMLRQMPGIFIAGEMADWSAPTGGYLLQGCFASAHAAALGCLSWLSKQAAAAARTA